MQPLPVLMAGSISASLAYLTFLAGRTVWLALRSGGRQLDAPDSDRALALSRLTIPVSIIVPARIASDVGDTIGSLLRLNYPEFEVIALVDTAAPGLPAIEKECELESIEFFYRRTLHTAPIRRILRSRREPRLLVVEKDPTSLVDAWNAGVNLARFRFIGFVPPGVTVDDDALLRAMAPAQADPGVVGIACPVECALDGGGRTFAARFERLRSLRSLMAARLFAGGLGLGYSGAVDDVCFWRRDAVLRAGGFSVDAVDAAREMAVGVESDPHCRVIRNRAVFGAAASTSGQQAGQRVRKLPGLLGRIGFHDRSETDWLVSLAQFWVVGGSVLSAGLGIVSWWSAAASLIALSLGNAAVHAAALVVRGAQAPLESKELTMLLSSAPLEWLASVPRRVTSFRSS